MSFAHQECIEAFFSDPKITKYLSQSDLAKMKSGVEFAETINIGRCRIIVSVPTKNQRLCETNPEISLKFEVMGKLHGYSTLGTIYYILHKDVCTGDYRAYYSVSYFLNSFEKSPFCTRAESIEMLHSIPDLREWMTWNIL